MSPKTESDPSAAEPAIKTKETASRSGTWQKMMNRDIKLKLKPSHKTVGADAEDWATKKTQPLWSVTRKVHISESSQEKWRLIHHTSARINIGLCWNLKTFLKDTFFTAQRIKCSFSLSVTNSEHIFFTLLSRWHNEVTQEHSFWCLFIAYLIAKGVREFVSYPPDTAARCHHLVSGSPTTVLPDGEPVVCTVTILSVVRLLQSLQNWSAAIKTATVYKMLYCDTYFMHVDGQQQ